MAMDPTISTAKEHTIALAWPSWSAVEKMKDAHKRWRAKTSVKMISRFIVNRGSVGV